MADVQFAVRGRHLPALDGVRALAIGGVVAYHLGLGWARGGYLGVDLFFVLSGFLITGLLLEERVAERAIGLAAFWARRARRLLPALLLLLAVVAAAALSGALPGVDLGTLRADGLATVAYVANWHQLVAGQSYFTQFSAPSPLQHTWSLAIEEQFYVVWPLLLTGALALLARRGRATLARARPVLVAATVVGALASAGWMAWLAAHGAGLDRLYYGTDTRAFDLLAGAALAMFVSARPAPVGRHRGVLHGAAVAAVVVLGLWWWRAGGTAGPPRVVFEGGMALCALAAVVLVADARLERPGPVGRVLSLAPLRYVGRISYGLYLWHWPVITQMTPSRTGLHGAALDVARLATMTAVSVASFHLVEQPLRRARLATWPRAARAVLAPAAMAVTAGVVVLGTIPVGFAAAAAGPAPAGPSVPGAGGVVGTLTPGLLAGGRPLRVSLVGDSVMHAQAPAVIAALDSTGDATVTDASFPGWGLSTDPRWHQDVPAMLARTRPQLVVGMWSWDDDWALATPAAYERVLAQFVQLVLRPPGATPGASAVVLEAFPPLGPLPFATGGPVAAARRSQGVTAWNAAASSMAARFPGRVVYLPVDASVEQGGRFADWLAPPGAPGTPIASWVRVRSVDNTHFCPAGAARYAAALAADLTGLVGLPATAAGWWNGSWQNDPAVYDTPSGSCPADHPG
ncbi:MAG: acyltransferase family protein [Acidimicrobiales bacterium]